MSCIDRFRLSLELASENHRLVWMSGPSIATPLGAQASQAQGSRSGEDPEDPNGAQSFPPGAETPPRSGSRGNTARYLYEGIGLFNSKHVHIGPSEDRTKIGFNYVLVQNITINQAGPSRNPPDTIPTHTSPSEILYRTMIPVDAPARDPVEQMPVWATAFPSMLVPMGSLSHGGHPQFPVAPPPIGTQYAYRAPQSHQPPTDPPRAAPAEQQVGNRRLRRRLRIRWRFCVLM
ncbi:hypothetical protein N656DRAFT_107996 [Canariomyces notabilis]|uniref:Uncharacterized protein n=1 Tax=Canariomyces notabilis TaxID=2074819 RepID=A0AAN6TDH4_9PEZI|nr:hypothetical protein N656DRAFT_107996 [Canariomyces arenarius]